jgi:hypothetical protein
LIPGHADGDLDEVETHPIERFCRTDHELWRRPKDDDEEDRSRGHPRGRDLFGGVSRWLGNRGRERVRDPEHTPTGKGDRGIGYQRAWGHLSHSPPQLVGP